MKKYRTKKEKVYYELRDEIVQGSVAPGSRLTITSLAEKFEVSEIPVREAVQQLVQERYLVTAPHMGSPSASSATRTCARRLRSARHWKAWRPGFPPGASRKGTSESSTG